MDAKLGDKETASVYPRATPKNTDAEQITFFVCPLTFPPTSDRPSTNTAFELPVIQYPTSRAAFADGGHHAIIANPATSGG